MYWRRTHMKSHRIIIVHQGFQTKRGLKRFLNPILTFFHDIKPWMQWIVFRPKILRSAISIKMLFGEWKQAEIIIKKQFEFCLSFLTYIVWWHRNWRIEKIFQMLRFWDIITSNIWQKIQEFLLNCVPMNI